MSPAPTPPAPKKTKAKGLPPLALKAVEFSKSPFFIGLLITLMFIFFARTFYQIRNQNRIDLNDGRLTTRIFRAVEALDFLLTDGRFLIRGEKKSEAPVALLTVDDRSIEEVGRWPWSRDKIAQISNRMMDYGAKAVGFDIVFSEPQEDPRMESFRRIEQKVPALPPDLKALLEAEKNQAQPDRVLSQVIENHKDRLVLGAFPDESFQDQSEPYTDYCRNEAFNRANASKFIKLENVSFVVIDSTDLFESVKFDELFNPIFNDIEKKTIAAALRDFQKPAVETLSDTERRKLQFLINKATMDYCDHWLTPQDEYGPMSETFFGKLTQTSDLFKGMDAAAAIHSFSKRVLIYPMPQYHFWTINTDTIQSPAVFTASFAAIQDNDGKIRHNPMFYRTGNRLGVSFVPSLALQTYLASNPGYQAQVEVDADPKDRQQKKIKSFVIVDTNKDNAPVMEIPVDGQGRLKINYAGGPKMFAYVPAKELLHDRPTMTIQEKVWVPELKRFIEQDREVKKAEFIKDRSFIFGATAIGVYDLRVTPFEKNFPGPETHLNVLANLYEQNFLKTDPNEANKMTWGLVIFGLLLSFAVAQSGALLGFVVMLASEAALVFLDQWLLRKGIVTTMVLPALLIVSIYVFLTLYKYFTEERKKQHLRSTFAKYVSPTVVDEILKSPENIQLGGKKQRMSVFFSDVRGFTTISEKLDPQVLSDVLNAYLTPMTEIVFANRGTLDKYMGDAIMAFFGAPIQYPDHAKYACRCALQSIQKLREIQAEFKAKGLPEIDIGIGINTSDMSVGNMGSNTVRSYTVMGDGVNLGSRLEGINKEYGTRIIISEFTYADVKDSFTAREVDWVRVKGKNEPVRIYELICEGKPPADWVACLEKFNQGFQYYHARNFRDAKVCFQEALVARPGDPVSELYLERCDEYYKEPPPENWDGVYVMKTK
jgi:adenylate cyclase